MGFVRYPPDETLTYRLDRLDFAVVVIGAVLVVGLVLDHIRRNY